MKVVGWMFEVESEDVLCLGLWDLRGQVEIEGEYVSRFEWVYIGVDLDERRMELVERVELVILGLSVLDRWICRNDVGILCDSAGRIGKWE